MSVLVNAIGILRESVGIIIWHILSVHLSFIAGFRNSGLSCFIAGSFVYQSPS